MVYLISPKRLIDPSFLAGDWSNGKEDLLMSLFFTVTISPFWLLFTKWLYVAMASRILLWSLILIALIKLAKTLNVGFRYFLFAVFMFVFVDQSISSGEWIFGGAEQKVWAYFFFFLSLSELLNKRYFRAGLNSGLAISSHVIVGGYSLVAIGVAMVFCLKKNYMGKLFKFFGPVILFGAPILFFALQYLGNGSSVHGNLDGGLGATAINVFFRNPHHLDPNAFDRIGILLLLAMGFFTLMAILKGKPWQPYRKELAIVFIVPWFFFAIGILARIVGAIWVLKFYPFRFADTLTSLLFWILVPSFVLNEAPNYFRKRLPDPYFFNRCCLAAMSVIIFRGTLAIAVPCMVSRIHASVQEWSQFLN